MWIKPAAGRGHEIGWDLRRRIFLSQLVNVALDALDQRLVGRPEIRSPGVCRVVRCRNSLGGVVGVWSSRRRWPAMEISLARELLADQGRPYHLAVPLQKAALRLIGEDDVRDAGYGKRIS